MASSVFLCTAALLMATGAATAVERGDSGETLRVRPEIRSLRDSATLHDVCFVNSTHGWAVGDSGVVLATVDGGQSWVEQESGTTLQLTTVTFADMRRGWIGGRISMPGARRAIGILLSTEDGGRTWNRSDHEMPTIERLRFLTPRTGIAVGGLVPFGSTGILHSDSGGLGWDAFSKPLCRSGWSDGDFRSMETDGVPMWFGVVCGPAGIAAVNERAIFQSLEMCFGTADGGVTGGLSVAPRSVAIDSLSKGGDGPIPVVWCVGEGGLLLRSDDFGLSWQKPPTLPDGIAAVDLRCVAVQGERVRVAGAPGDHIWCSDDSGATWRAKTTGQMLPIERISLMGERGAVAVGSLGVVLVSDDISNGDNETWRVVRGGGRRAAVVTMVESVDGIPWEPLIEAAGRGYHAAIVLCDAVVANGRGTGDVVKWNPDGDLADGALRRRRAAEAAAMLGIAFHESIVAAADGSDSDNALRVRLMAQIRSWRPSLLLVGRSGNSSGGERFTRLVLEAVSLTESAGTGMESEGTAWSVMRVDDVSLTASPGEVAGGVEMNLCQLHFRLGKRTFDAAATARATTAMCWPESLPMQVVCTPISGKMVVAGRGGLLSGITEPAEAGGRSLWNDGLRDDVEIAVWRMALHRASKALDSMATFDSEAWNGFLRHEFPTIVESLGPEAGTAIAMATAQRAFRQGANGVGVRVLEWMIEHFPDTPIEIAAQSILFPRLYGDEIVESNPPDASARLHKATQWLAALRKSPICESSPGATFFRASVERRAGESAVAARLYDDLANSGMDDVWSRHARWERNRLRELNNSRDGSGFVPSGSTPSRSAVPVFRCDRTPDPPLLDGNPDEPFWSVAGTWIPLRRTEGGASAVAEPYPASVCFAHDEEFLYIAFEMAEIPGLSYASVAGAVRPRDARLDSRDRIEITLDTDRDLATWYRFTLDGRGWSREEASGDPTWNPTWYVASGVRTEASGRRRTVEAAIPLAEFGDAARDIASGRETYWNVSLRRMTPDDGVRAAVSGALRFGLPISEASGIPMSPFQVDPSSSDPTISSDSIPMNTVERAPLKLELEPLPTPDFEMSDSDEPDPSDSVMVTPPPRRVERIVPPPKENTILGE